MGKRGSVASPAGRCGTTGHLGCGYDSPAERPAAVLAWIGEGLTAGKHASHVAGATPDGLRAERADLRNRDALHACGTLRVTPSSQVYGTADLRPDASRSVHGVEDLAAFADGGTVRLGGDVDVLSVGTLRQVLGP